MRILNTLKDDIKRFETEDRIIRAKLCKEIELLVKGKILRWNTDLIVLFKSGCEVWRVNKDSDDYAFGLQVDYKYNRMGVLWHDELYGDYLKKLTDLDTKLLISIYETIVKGQYGISRDNERLETINV